MDVSDATKERKTGISSLKLKIEDDFNAFFFRFGRKVNENVLKINHQR